MPIESSPLSPNNKDRHFFECKNQLSEVKNLSKWLNHLIPTLGYSSKLLFAVDLVAEELLSNIINYAFDDVFTHLIHIELLTKENAIIITFKDDGKPFNPFEDFSINLPNSLEEAGLGGLGIHLVKSYANKYEYSRSNNLNILSITIVEDV